ncbi:hypothetical protein HK101_006329, partial [Irineochytrium annulatum]
EELKYNIPKPVKVYEDSQSLRSFVETRKRTDRNRHVDPKFFYVCDVNEHGNIKVIEISTHEQPADLLTKPLEPEDFKKKQALTGLR